MATRLATFLPSQGSGSGHRVSGVLDGFRTGTAEVRIDARHHELLDPALLAPEPGNQGIELIAMFGINLESPK
jgi:hypothetical protein